MPPRYLRFRDAFAEVLDPRTHTIEWLDSRIASGLMHSWGNEKACVLTELRQFPTGAFEVHVMIAAGDADVMVNEIMPQIMKWKDKIGALHVSVASRLAWVRLLKPLGFEVWQTEVRA